MNTKIIRKIASIMMVTAIMFSTLATPVSNIGKLIIQATEEAETITEETPTDEVGDISTSDSETAPIDAVVDSDVEDPSSLVSSDTDPPVETAITTEEPTTTENPATTTPENPATTPTEEPTTTENPTPTPAEKTASATTSALEAPTTQAICAEKDEPTFEDAFQITENGELVNKIGLKYKNGPSDFYPTNTITSVRLVKTSINDGDPMSVVNAGTLVGPITNPSRAIVDPSIDSGQTNGTYTATWNLTPLDIYRIQQEVSGNHTNVKLYYTFTGPGGCETTSITNNTQTSLLDNFQVDIPDPEVTIKPCITNCTSVEITVDYEDFKTALDITDVQYTSYQDYYDNARIQIILQDPLTGGPIALDLDGTAGAPNTTSVDLSGDGTLTKQVFCIDLAPYYTAGGTIDPKLYTEHTYTTNILEPVVPATVPPTTMVVADVATKFDLPDPLFIDSTAFTAVATDDNEIDVTFKVATNTYLAADLAGSILIKNTDGDVVDTITLTGTEIKNSATTAITKTSDTPSVPYVPGATYTAVLDVYAKNSAGVKIGCSDATASRTVRMQTTPSLVASECTTNCTSITLTPTIDTTFYAGKIMRLYVDDGDNFIQLDLDPTAGISYYQSISTYTSGTPFCIDLTKVFTTTDGSIDPKVYEEHTYTLKVFANDTATTPLKTITSNSQTVLQPPIISDVTAVAEYDNHITVDYDVDDKGYDNLIGEIRIYNAAGTTLIETINLSESDIDGGIAKTSVKTYEPGVTYKVVLDVYAKDSTDNIIPCSQKTDDTTVTMKTALDVDPYQVCDDGCNVTFDFTYDGSMYPVGSDINILATNTNGTAGTSDDIILPIQKVGDTVADDGTTVALKFLLPDNDLLYTTYHYDISIDASAGYDPTIGTDFELKEAPMVDTFTMDYAAGVITFTYDVDVNDFSGASAHIELYKDGATTPTDIPITTAVAGGHIADTKTISNLEPGDYSAQLIVDYAIDGVDCDPVPSDVRYATVAYPNPEVTPYQVCDDGCNVTFDITYDGSMYPVGSDINILATNTKGTVGTGDDVVLPIQKVGDTVTDDDKKITVKFLLPDNDLLYTSYHYDISIDVPGVVADPTTGTNFELKEAPMIDTFDMDYAAGVITFTYDVDVNDFSGASAHIELYKDGATTPTNIPITTAVVDGHIADTKTISNLEPGDYSAQLIVDYAISGVDCDPVSSDVRYATVAYPNPEVDPYQVCDDGCNVTFDITYDGSMYPVGSDINILATNTKGTVGTGDDVVLPVQKVGDTIDDDTTITVKFLLPNNDLLYTTYHYDISIDVPGVTADPITSTNFELKEAPTIDTFDMDYAAGTITFTYDVDVNDFSGASAHIELYKDDETTPTNIPITTAVVGGHIADTKTISDLEPGDYSAQLIVDYAIGGVDCDPVPSDLRVVSINYPDFEVSPYQVCDDGCNVTFDITYDGSMYPVGSDINILATNTKGTVGTGDDVVLPVQKVGDTVADDGTTITVKFLLPDNELLYTAYHYDISIDVPGVTTDPTIGTNFKLKEAPTIDTFDMDYAAGAITFTYDVDANDFGGANPHMELYKDGATIPTIIPITTAVVDGHIVDTITISDLEPGDYSAQLIVDYAIDGVDCDPIPSDIRYVTVDYPNPDVTPYQVCDDGCNVTFDITYDGSMYPIGSDINILATNTKGTVGTGDDVVLPVQKVGDTVADDGTTIIVKFLLPDNDLLYTQYHYDITIDVPGVTTDPTFGTNFELKEAPTIDTFDMDYAAGAITFTYDVDVNDFSGANPHIELYKDGATIPTIIPITTTVVDGHIEDTKTISNLEPGDYSAQLIVDYAIDGVDCDPVPSDIRYATAAYPNPEVTPYQVCDDGCNVTFDITYDGSMYPVGSDINILATNTKGTVGTGDDVVLPIQKVGDTVATDDTTITVKFLLPDNDLLYTQYHYDISIDVPGVTTDPTFGTNFELKEAPMIDTFDMDYAAGAITFTYDVDVNDFSGASAHIELYKDGATTSTNIPITTAVVGGHIVDTKTISGLEPGDYSAQLIVDYAIDGVGCDPVPSDVKNATVAYPNPEVTPYQVCDDGCNVTFDFTYDGSMYPIGSDINILATNTKGTVGTGDDVVLPIQKVGDTVATDDTTITVKFLLPDNDLLYTTYHYDISIDVPGVTADPTIGTNFELKEAPMIDTFDMDYAAGAITFTYDVDVNDFSGASAHIELYKDGATTPTNIPITTAIVDGHIAATKTISGLEPGDYSAQLIVDYAIDGVGCDPVPSDVKNATVAYPNPEVTPYQVCDDGCNVTFDFTYDGSMYPVGSDINILATNTKGTVGTGDDVVLPIQKVGDTVATDDTTITVKFLLPDNDLLYTTYHYDISIDVPSVTADPTIGTNFELKEAPTIDTFDMDYAAGAITFTYDVDVNDFSGASAHIELYKDGATTPTNIPITTAVVDGHIAATKTISGLEPGDYSAQLIVDYAIDGVGCDPVPSDVKNATVAYPNPEVTPYQVCDDGCNVTFDFTYDGSMYPVGSDINILATNTKGTVGTGDDVVLPIQKVGDTVATDDTTITVKFLLPDNDLLYTTYHYDISIDVPSVTADPTIGTNFELKEAPTIDTFDMDYAAGAITFTYDVDVNDFSGASAHIELYKDGATTPTNIPITTAVVDGHIATTKTISDLEPADYSAQLIVDYAIDGVGCDPVPSELRVVSVNYPDFEVTPYQICDDGCNVTFDITYDGSMYPVGSDINILATNTNGTVTTSDDVILPIQKVGDTVAADGTTITAKFLLPDNALLYTSYHYDISIDVPGVTADPTIGTNFELKEAPMIDTFNMDYAAGEITFTYDIDVNDFSGANAHIELYKDGVTTLIPITTAVTDGHIANSITINDLEPGDYSAKLIVDYAINGVGCDPVPSDVRYVTVAYPDPEVTPYQVCDDGCNVTFDFTYDGSMYPVGSDINILATNTKGTISTSDDVVLPVQKVGGTVANDDTTVSLKFLLPNDSLLYTEYQYDISIDVPGVTADPTIDTSFELKEVPIPVTFNMNYAAGVITFDYDIDVNDFSDAEAYIELYKDGATTPTTTIPITTDVDGGHITDSITIDGLELGVYKSILVIDYAIDGIDCEPVTKDSREVIVAYPNPSVTAYQVCDDGCDVTFDLSYDGTKYPAGSKIYLTVYDKDHKYLKEVEIGATKAGATTIDTLTYTLDDDSILYDNHYYTFRIDIPSVTADPTISTSFELKEAPIPVTFDMNYAAGVITFDYDIDVNDFSGATANIELYKDGVTTPTSTIPITTAIVDGHINDSITISGLEPGVYKSILVIDYAIDGVDCEPVTKDSRDVTVAYPNPTLRSYQACDDGCDVTFDLSYDGTKYPIGSKIYLTVYDKDHNFLKEVEIGATKAGATTVDNLTYTLPNDSILYDIHSYAFRIDIPGVTADPTVEADFELKEAPTPLAFDMNYAAGALTFDFDIDVKDFIGTKVRIDLYKDGVLIPTVVPLSNIVKDGHIAELITIDKLEPGVYSAKLVIDYAIGGVDCEPLIAESRAIPVAYAAPSVRPYQICDDDCNVTFDLTYDGSTYPSGSPIHFITYDNEGEVATDTIVGNTSNAVDAKDTFKYDLAADDLTKDALFDAYNYTFKIDIAGVLADPFIDTTYTLLEKPSITTFDTSYAAGEITINYDYSANDFANASAYISISKDGEHFDDINFEDFSGTIVLDHMLPGVYTAELIINYAIDGVDCIAINQVNEPITVAYPNPSITPSQDCKKDCIVDIELDYDASMYPIDSEVVVLKDDMEVLRYSITDMSHNVEGTNMYNYELTVEDFDKHDYVVYIDTMMDEEVLPYSELIEFALLEKPEVKSLNLSVNSDSTITAKYDVDLNGYPKATGVLVVTGPNDYVKQYDIDSDSLANGSFTTDILESGEYEAMLTINYGEECPPVTFDSNMVEIKPKLVYTGFETNVFEAFIIRVREMVSNG